ncbi:MAG TPA: putative toxin-antitoxin system toxin component, PIN family [Thermomicrobiales bacterium]|nr:putative toxin-antitoxin system toxin component, PIN family [Thermomicrobiales bacterium]
MLDANIIVSAAYTYGNPSSTMAGILRAGIRDRYTLVISDHILQEIRSTLSKSFFVERIDPDVIDQILEDLCRKAMLIDLDRIVERVATHWQDDLVLSTALSGDADFLVTGDRELLGLDHPFPFRIIHPNEFAGLL